MIHKLEPILDHPTYQMQEILLAVVDAAVEGTAFSKNIFPDILQDNWTINGVFVRKLENVLYSYINGLEDKEAFKNQFLNNNNIKELCNDNTIVIISTIDWDIEENLKKFFLSCYAALDSKMYCIDDTYEKARKEYDELFRTKNKYVCPFCGLHKYPNINAIQRADFDHYIYKGDYPLASANMANLIPMCAECNRDIKKTRNVLLNGANRTYVFYPYDEIPEINFDVVCNREPGADLNDKGEWNINITPVLQNIVIEKKIETWDRVFDVKQRYINDIEEFHDAWILDALQSKSGVFSNYDSVRSFMQTKSTQLIETVQRKMKPSVYIEMIFFKFMAENTSDRFINRYFQLHNNKINLEGI